MTIVIYIDDIVLMGATVEEVWPKVMKAIRSLTKMGFKINLVKCTLLSDGIQVMGMDVIRGVYSCKPSKIRRVIGAAIPKTFQEL